VNAIEMAAVESSYGQEEFFFNVEEKLKKKILFTLFFLTTGLWLHQIKNLIKFCGQRYCIIIELGSETKV
jgi:hypothetical protein